jgi:hypothetical protein
MGDKKYAKLKPAKMGFRFLELLPEKRRALLSDALDTLTRDMGASWNTRVAGKEIFWINLWQDEEDTDGSHDIMEISDQTIAKSLYKWCRRAVRKYCPTQAIMDGYGFVVNPHGSRHQVWHIDYTTDAAVVWIPMTPLTDKNATQYITLPRKTPKDLLEQVASDVDKVDVDAIAAGVDYLFVQQIIAKPMSVLYMGRGTIHRGIANSGPDHRVAFYISVHFIKDYKNNYPYSSESAGASESDIETFGK